MQLDNLYQKLDEVGLIRYDAISIPIIENDELVDFAQVDAVILEAFTDDAPRIAVDKPSFEAMFGSVIGAIPNDASAEDRLIALVDADDNGDGTHKGYADYFAGWFAHGVLD